MAWTTGRQTPKIIQVDINPDRIGLTKKVTVGIVGDAKQVASSILEKLADNAGDEGREDRKAEIATRKSPGPSSWPRWITKTTIRAPLGTNAPAQTNPTG